MSRYELFSKLLKKLGKQTEWEIVFTKDNVADGDDFLIFGSWRKSIKVNLKRGRSGIWVVYFDCDEPMLLENCGESFWRSILLNI